jgi:ankyrin repeat protein
MPPIRRRPIRRRPTRRRRSNQEDIDPRWVAEAEQSSNEEETPIDNPRPNHVHREWNTNGELIRVVPMPPVRRHRSRVPCRDPNGRYARCPMTLQNFTIVTPEGIRQTPFLDPVIPAGIPFMPLYLRSPNRNGENSEWSSRWPLHSAVWYNNRYEIDVLLSLMNINQRDGVGRTPLFYTSDVGIAAYLLDRGADINARDGNGETPLHWAAQWENSSDRALDMAALLIRRGADINARDGNGETALQLAMRREDNRMMALLLRAGADDIQSTEYGNVFRLRVSNDGTVHRIYRDWSSTSNRTNSNFNNRNNTPNSPDVHRANSTSRNISNSNRREINYSTTNNARSNSSNSRNSNGRRDRLTLGDLLAPRRSSSSVMSYNNNT